MSSEKLKSHSLCGHRQYAADGSVVTFASLMGGIGVIDRAVQEWTGLLVYWIAGRISKPFPAPM
jgi:hypothetical protein